MSAVDLDDATTELYGLTPADFTARRTELAAEARKEGAKDLAKQISELRRPTVSAWLVNQLVRGAAGAEGDVADLEELGTDLRAAQAQLDGPRMKELTRRRHELVAALVRRADEVVDDDGPKVSPATRRELEETFGAAVADEQAALAVSSGRLTRALAYAGFGEVDVTEATATPLSSSRPSPRARSGSATGAGTKKDDADETGGTEAAAKAAGAEAAQAERERKKEAAAAAERAEAAEIARADETAAEEDLAAAAQHRDDVRAEEARLTGTLEDLQREIVRVRRELDDLTRSIAAADRDYQRRERQLEQARKVVRALPEP